MTAPIAEETTQYVTQAELDRMFQSLADRFQETDDAQRQRFDDFRQDVISLIQQNNANNLAAMQKMVDERVAKERVERETEIDSLSGELRTFAKDINTQLGEMQKGFSKITGLIESLPETLKARDEKDAEIHKAIHARIDNQAEQTRTHNTALSRMQSDIDAVESKQDATTAEVKRIRSTIHGDPENKDDAPSLFKMMGELKEQMTMGFTNVGSRLDLSIAETVRNRADIETIQKERAQEKKQWSQRWDTAKALGKELLKSWWVRLALGALVASLVVSLFPELRPPLIENLMNQISRGGN